MTALEALRILELQPPASLPEVKAAFRRMAMKFHPDLAGETASPVQFIQVQEAWDLLQSFGEGNWNEQTASNSWEHIEKFEKGNREVSIPETQFYRDLEDFLLSLHIPLTFLTQKGLKGFIPPFKWIFILMLVILLPALIAFAFVAVPLYFMYAWFLDQLYAKLSSKLFFYCRLIPVVLADFLLFVGCFWLSIPFGWFLYLSFSLGIFFLYMHICLFGALKRLKKGIPY